METITTKNIKTNKAEIIEQQSLEMKEWGFSFFTNTELEAYKSAYLYRYSKHGVKIEHAKGIKKWMVTVFNETAVKSGIDGAV